MSGFLYVGLLLFSVKYLILFIVFVVIVTLVVIVHFYEFVKNKITKHQYFYNNILTANIFIWSSKRVGVAQTEGGFAHYACSGNPSLKTYFPPPTT